MREVKIFDIFYFALFCFFFYRNRCWRPWLLLFALLLLFSLLSKYCINIIIAIIIVLLLRPTRLQSPHYKCNNCELSLWCNRILHNVFSSSKWRFIARSHVLHRPDYDTHLWKNICPYILSSRLLFPHPSFIFMYHVMMGNNCTSEDILMQSIIV